MRKHVVHHRQGTLLVLLVHRLGHPEELVSLLAVERLECLPLLLGGHIEQRWEIGREAGDLGQTMRRENAT